MIIKVLFSIVLIVACSFADSILLQGAGYAHYHYYPDTGQAYCGMDIDFLSYEKRIAAVSPSIHAFFYDSLCENLDPPVRSMERVLSTNSLLSACILYI